MIYKRGKGNNKKNYSTKEKEFLSEKKERFKKSSMIFHYGVNVRKKEKEKMKN
jgi:hypothetical protein